MILLNICPRGSGKTTKAINLSTSLSSFNPKDVAILTRRLNVHHYYHTPTPQSNIKDYVNQLCRYSGETLIIDDVYNIGLIDKGNHEVYENLLHNLYKERLIYNFKNIIIFESVDLHLLNNKFTYLIRENFFIRCTSTFKMYGHEVVINDIQNMDYNYRILENSDRLQPIQYCSYIDNILSDISLNLLPEERNIIGNRTYQYNIQTAKKSLIQ